MREINAKLLEAGSQRLWQTLYHGGVNDVTDWLMFVDNARRSKSIRNKSVGDGVTAVETVKIDGAAIKHQL